VARQPGSIRGRTLAWPRQRRHRQAGSIDRASAAHDAPGLAPDVARLPETSRERVIAAAAELFRTRGFGATSMREVAERAGLGKSSLYHHIPGKQELLGEIVERGITTLMHALEQVAAADLPAPERLRLAVRSHVLTSIEHRDSAACFIQEGNALSREQHASYMAKRDRYEAWLRQIVGDGQRSGEFRPMEVRLAVLAILGMCHWVVRWYRPDGDFTAEQIAAEFAEYAVRGLSSDAPLAPHAAASD
jgi:AcrR family transcriptional regulator